MAKLTKQQFFDRIATMIILVRNQSSPIFLSERLAQSLLETGGVIHPWNNLGGIKVGMGLLTSYWRGSVVNKSAWEVIKGREFKETAAFRAYQTLYHYFKDELYKKSRYSRVLTAKTPYEQATEPNLAGYANKFISIIKQYSLEKYEETPAKPEPTKENPQIIQIVQFVVAGYYERGVNYVPIRKIAELVGAKVVWKQGTVTVQGSEVEVRIEKSTSYMMAREVASLLNLKLEWDSYAKVLFFN